MLWMLHNVGGEEADSKFLNISDPKFIKHYIESGNFDSSKGYIWKLRYHPFSEDSNTKSQFCLFAIPNEYEKSIGKMDRVIDFSVGVINPNLGECTK